MRRREERPLLLHGRRMAIQLFALVSGTEPFRAYVHHDAVVWRAARKHDPQQPHLDGADASQRLGPRRVASKTADAAALRPNELLPISALWHALAEGATTAADSAPRAPHEVWRALERAAVLAVGASFHAKHEPSAAERIHRAAAAQ